MKKTLVLLLLLISLLSVARDHSASNFLLQTKNSMFYFTATKNKPIHFRYFGNRIDNIESLNATGTLNKTEAHPTFGVNCIEEKALHVTHADGNMSTELYFQSYKKTQIDNNVTLHKFELKDPQYPFFVNLYYKSFYNEDVFMVWTEISHKESAPITLYKYASFDMPVKASEYWLTHFHGNWATEFGLYEEKLNPGLMVLKNRQGIRSTQRDNSAFMLSLNEKSHEDHGEIIAGALAYTGNYKVAFDYDLRSGFHFIAGINEDASHYTLEKDEPFETPAFVITHSTQGKGLASRNLHKWARNYQVLDGNNERMILLNSWEGVYFDIEEKTMLGMIDDIADLGGELFVMDDGWFGDKYQRNNGSSSLGDWVVDKQKLPNGLQPLIDRAKEKGIKFGIWLEPEMTDDKSELFEKHPEWVISQPNRNLVKGRGNAQLTLDMSNPKVQNFVFSTIDDLLNKHPEIAYIKWDANHFISNYGSNYLPANKQSHLYIEYNRGMIKTLERIRDKHPNLIMQVCSSGGGRVSYGYMPYFQEFWTSDNTDAMTRISMQWGVSHFFPANTMAAHVSAFKNHQTGRMLPLKFRFDVAMTGRLGMEMQPKDLTPEEKDFSKKAIKTYKEIRPIIQLGDLYRIDSPFDNNGISSSMYLSTSKNKAVLFVFMTEKWQGRIGAPIVKMKGLDPNKKYKLKEINTVGEKSCIPANNKIIDGNTLMSTGIKLKLVQQYSSAIIAIEEITEN